MRWTNSRSALRGEAGEVDPAVGGELLEVGLHRERGCGAEDRLDVVPDCVQQAGSGALAGLERFDETPLALASMLDVFVDLRVRIGDRLAVARVKDARAEPA